ncbi:hypothetical protein AcW1_004469 [Taiwanofungus camphoratus]|nr:hypothetical protein AcW2_006526 [Antrodia cinnamomea]KAI0939417.1 hypothetical protein AcV5_000844 [Antrodia cinnamomea]KAI0952342.1 hypothetical protein AcV7_008184 [Antrodia cinnamomea]KAI0959725.1 hypothetical protein AcW1_004469 [Antrodia cinnamomea]
MRRPGPLQDLPLEHFLPLDPNLPKHPRPNKRPHSPGVTSLYSPTKRRILTEEGIYSPHKAVKSPLSSSRGRFAPSYFDSLIRGPNSPAKRLDFGLTKIDSQTSLLADPRILQVVTTKAQRDDTPVSTCPSNNTLAPSPKLLASGSRTKSVSCLDGYSDYGDELYNYDMQSCVVPTRATTPVMIPREIIPPDRQSVHYPGFDIFQDAYILLPDTTQCISGSRSETGASESETGSETGRAKEGEKENLPPRKRLRKSTTAPAVSSDAAWSKVGLLSPGAKRQIERGGKAKSIPVTPHTRGIYTDFTKERIREGSVTPAARRPWQLESAGSVGNGSPVRMPVGKEERRARRRALEEEVDGSDEDDNILL